MQWLIIYDTKHGATKEIAESLGKFINDNIDVNINIVKVGEIRDKVKIEEYRVIIILSPVYVGLILKSIKQFMAENTEAIKSKFFAFIAVGLGGRDEYIRKISMFTPPQYYKNIGGRLVFSSLSTGEKQMVVRMEKREFNESEIIDNISAEEIRNTASEIIQEYLTGFDNGVKETLKKEFNKEGAEGKDILFGLKFKDLKMSYTLSIKNGEFEINKETEIEPNLTFVGDSETFFKIIEKKNDANELYVTGELDSTGDLRYLYDFYLIFPYMI